MKKGRLIRYKYYRYLLFECKKIQISNLIDEQIENKIPTYGRTSLNKQKQLSLFR